MRARSTSVVRWDSFELDLRSGELRKAGTPIRIQPHPTKVLCLLASRAGQLVTREELRTAVWGEDTFVDFEQGLNFCIRQLRQALGERPEHPHYIETLPKRGYRFIAPLQEAQTDPRIVSEGSRLPAQSRRRLMTLLVTIFAGSLLAGALYFGRSRSSLGQAKPGRRVMLAVLPFENMTADPTQDYFSEGLTEETITDLGELQPERMGVIARTSAMQYRHTTKPITVIGRELAVDYILEGGVRRQGNRVRITAQLIQVSDQTHLWTAAYDRELSDILGVQSQIAKAIAHQIDLKLNPEQRRRLSKSRPVNSEAYDDYLKGRYLWNRRTELAMRQGLQLFQLAIQKDPQYGLAYAGMADSYIMLGNWRFLPPGEAYPKAKQAAQMALQIDQGIAEAQTSLAFATFLYDRDWQGAEQGFRRAISLNPNYPLAHHFYAVYLVAAGRTSDAVAEIRRAQELDPLSMIIHSVAAWIYELSHQYDKAIEQGKKTFDLDPNYGPTHMYVGESYIDSSHCNQGIAELQRALELSGEDSKPALDSLGHAYAVCGKRQSAMEIISRLQKLSRTSYVSAYDYARIYAGLGDTQKTLASLRRAVDERSPWVVLLSVEPDFESLHSNPEFTDLEQRTGIPNVAK